MPSVYTDWSLSLLQIKLSTLVNTFSMWYISYMYMFYIYIHIYNLSILYIQKLQILLWIGSRRSSAHNLVKIKNEWNLSGAYFIEWNSYMLEGLKTIIKYILSLFAEMIKSAMLKILLDFFSFSIILLTPFMNETHPIRLDNSKKSLHAYFQSGQGGKRNER